MVVAVDSTVVTILMEKSVEPHSPHLTQWLEPVKSCWAEPGIAEWNTTIGKGITPRMMVKCYG